MNFGQNLYDWFKTNAQQLVYLAIIVIGLYLAFKREITKLIGLGVIAVVVVLLVFNTTGVQKFLLELGNKVLGIS